MQICRYTYTQLDPKATKSVIIQKKGGTGIKKLKHRPEGTLFAGQDGGEFGTEVTAMPRHYEMTGTSFGK